MNDDILDLEKALTLVENAFGILEGGTPYGIAVSALELVGRPAAKKGFPDRGELFDLIGQRLGASTTPKGKAAQQEISNELRIVLQTLKTKSSPVVRSGANKGFTETRFVENFEELLDRQAGEGALNYLIENLPNFTKSKMNRKEKLKHLTFAGRLLQTAGLGKYGIDKVSKKAHLVRDVAEKYGLKGKNTFVDFGCGAHEPLALSTFFYANGFKRCMANDFLPVRNERYAAVSMYDCIAYMRMFPEKFLAFDQTRSAFEARLAGFDLDALRIGNFLEGIGQLSGEVDFISADIVEAGLEDDSVSLIASFAVLEHVMDIEGVCNYLFHKTEPGGLHYHFIDLADHRCYRNDGKFNKFSFLTEAEGPSNINRLRASEHLAAFKRAGFDVLSEEHQREKIPTGTYEKILPQWKDLPEEDLTAVSLTVVLRKPQ